MELKKLMSLPKNLIEERLSDLERQKENNKSDFDYIYDKLKAGGYDWNAVAKRIIKDRLREISQRISDLNGEIFKCTAILDGTIKV